MYTPVIDCPFLDRIKNNLFLALFLGTFDTQNYNITNEDLDHAYAQQVVIPKKVSIKKHDQAEKGMD